MIKRNIYIVIGFISPNMAQKILILYDLKGKSDVQRTQIQRKLYGYRDNSNYDYSYDRIGKLTKLEIEKSKKIVLHIKNKKDVSKVTTLFNELQIKFEIAKT